MIDQTKDKKDDVLASKIEADKDQKQKTGLPQAMKLIPRKLKNSLKSKRKKPS